MNRQFQPFPSYWLSVSGEFDYYRGENLWENWSLKGTASFGKIFPFKAGNLSAGVFLTASHFDRNSDFYTFGHGGYFSPHLFVMGGPSLGFKSKACKTFQFEGNLGGGPLYFETEDSPRYPLLDESELSGLSSRARSEALGIFEGDRFTGLGYSGHLQGTKLLSPHRALTAFGDFNKSADFNHCQLGLKLSYYLDTPLTPFE